MRISSTVNAARCAAMLATIAVSAAARAAAPGNTQDFSGAGNLGGFFSGGANALTNPGTDGVGGAPDGYLEITSLFAGNFGCGTGDALFTGNYPASGVGGVSFWLRDTGAPDPLRIHLLLGLGQPNHWIYHAEFVPTPQWRKHYVNLSTVNPAHWTRTHGVGALAAAIADVQRLNFRHDLPPYMTNPDEIRASLGVDRVRLHPPCAGETNGDDVIDFSDLNNCLSDFGQSGINLPGDVNNSGGVDFVDLNIVLSAFGTAC